MKLHLPIGLRAALLAVLSYAVLPAAQAADPAVFYKSASNTVTKVATQTYGDGQGAMLGEVSQFDFYNADYLPGPEPAAGATDAEKKAYEDNKYNFSDKLQTPNDDINASTTNWVLDVTATNLRGTNLGDENYANSCMLLGNAPTGLYEITVEDPNDKWWDDNRDEWVYREETGRLLTFATPGGNTGNPTINKEGMGLFISDDGLLCWMSGYKCKVLGLIPGWSEQQDTFDISVRIEWCPDSTLPGGGALKLRGMWYIDPETGEKLGNIASAVGSIPEDGYVIMNNIAMPDNFLTSGNETEVGEFDLKNGGLATGANTGGKGSVTVSLYAENKSDEGEWRITGKANLGAEYKIKNDSTLKSIIKDNTDKVVFVGHDGCLNLTKNLAETKGNTGGRNYAGQQVSEYTYDNPTMAMADVANGGMTCSVGFSAEAGTQLVIAQNVLRSTILKDQIDAEGVQLDDEKAGVPVWLNVSGDGIVKLDLKGFYIWNGQTDNDKKRIDLKYLKEFELRNVNLTESATLDIDFNGDLKVDLGCGVFSKDATLVHSGTQGDTTIVLEAGKSAALAAIIKTAEKELVDPSVNDLPADKLADADTSKLIIGSTTGGVLRVGTIQNVGNVEIYGETYSDTIESTKHNVTLAASRIVAGSVAAKGEIVVDRGSATVTGSVTSNDKSVLVDEVASLSADSVTAKKVFVSGKMTVANTVKAEFTTEGTGLVAASDGASIAAGAIEADKMVAAYAGGRIVVTGDVTAGSVNTYADTDAKGKVTSSGSITVGGTITAEKVTAQGSGVTITRQTSGDMMSGAVIDSTGISAAQIMSGSEIAIDEDGTGVVLAGALDGVKVTVGGNAVLTNAKTQSMTRAASATRISNQSIVSNQVIEADTVNIAAGTGYEITAAGLQANAITVGSTTMKKGDTSTQKVVITDLGKLSETEISAGSIEADQIRFAAGYTVKNAAIDSLDMQLGAGGSLENVSLVGDSASFTADGDFSFKGLKLEAGQGYSVGSGTGSVTYTVGNGNADESVQAVYLTGNQEGNKAKLDKLVIDASHIEFGDTEQSVVVFDSTATGTMDTAGTDVQYILKPYVVVDKANATAGSFKAAKDVATVQAELKVDDATATALEALNEMQAALTPEEKADSPVQALHDALGLVYERDLKSRQEILQAITGASTTALADSQRRGVRDVQKNLRNRVIQLGGVTGEGDTGWVNSGIQGWAQADGSFSTTDGGEGTNGYDYSTTGATVGINMDLASNFVLGASFSTSFGKLDVEGPDNASGNNDAYYVSLFARHQYNRWVQMLILTAGMNDMTLDREIMGYKAQGETSGTSFSAYYELGYTMALDYNYNHILQPLVSFSITSATVDGYKEKGSIGEAGLDYDGSDAVYGQVGFGLRYQGVLYESVYQRCAVLEARALVTQDFGDSTDEAKVALQGGGDGFTVKGADSTGTGFEIGLGLSIPVEQQTTVYADVDFTYSPDYTGVRANVGLRYDF